MSVQKEKFKDELIIALTPFIQPEFVEAVKAKITILTHGYDISKAENEIIVYEGDVNERIVKRYLMAKTAQGLSKRTIEYYQQTLELFFGEIQKPFSQITADDIRYWIALKLSRDGVSKVGVNRKRDPLVLKGWFLMMMMMISFLRNLLLHPPRELRPQLDTKLVYMKLLRMWYRNLFLNPTI